MDPEIQRLIEITDTLQADLVAQDYDACAAGLQEREEILKNLCSRYATASGQPLPDDLNRVLQRIHDTDLQMEEILTQGLQETGQELARTSELKTPKPSAGGRSRCLNKIA